MEKEKIVRAHQRRTKSGRVITVRQHTAKYDAAEDLKKSLAKKEGAGSEILSGKLQQQWDEMIDGRSVRELYNMAKYDSDFFKDAATVISDSSLTQNDFIRFNGDKLRNLMKSAIRKRKIGNADKESINMWLSQPLKTRNHKR